jgi:predicted alpha/beta-fold hydrolase
VDIDKIFQIKQYREFDELYTIKMFNFETVHEYYTKSSSYLDVGKLKIPTIFFNSMNDRLSPHDTLDFTLCNF